MCDHGGDTQGEWCVGEWCVWVSGVCGFKPNLLIKIPWHLELCELPGRPPGSPPRSRGAGSSPGSRGTVWAA